MPKYKVSLTLECSHTDGHSNQHVPVDKLVSYSKLPENQDAHDGCPYVIEFLLEREEKFQWRFIKHDNLQRAWNQLNEGFTVNSGAK